MLFFVAANNLPSPSELPPWLVNTLFPVNRWVHLVASSLMVGGLLFFELVVPLATADLKEEQQMGVFGRARWVFRKVVWASFAALVVSGAFTTWRMWWIYRLDEGLVGNHFWLGSRPWVYVHVALGVLGLAMALRVTSTRRIHSHPVGWMRVILVMLLACVFTVSIARQVRLRIREWQEMQHLPPEAQPGIPAM